MAVCFGVINRKNLKPPSRDGGLENDSEKERFLERADEATSCLIRAGEDGAKG